MTNEEANEQLFQAAMSGDLAAARVAIDAGADVHAKDEDLLSTPLHVVTWKGHVEMARLLIDKGANVNAKDLNQYTPLHDAAWSGNAQIAKLLIDNGANVNVKDDLQDTPLQLAQRHGHNDVAAILSDAIQQQFGHAERITRQRNNSTGPEIGG